MLKNPVFTGSSLSFDGFTGYVNLGTMSYYPVAFNTAYYTVSVWVKTLMTGIGAVFGLIDPGNSNVFQLLLNTDQNDGNVSGKMQIYARDASNNFTAASPTSATTVNDGNWHHITITANTPAFSYQFYFDGIAVPTSVRFNTIVNNYSTFASSVYLGARNNNGITQNYFSGKIYQPRFYNTYLAPHEIFEAYKLGINSHKQIFAEYLNLETAGTTIADNTGNGNTGTINGAVTFSNDIPFM